MPSSRTPRETPTGDRPDGAARKGVLLRLGEACARRCVLVVLAWVVALAGLQVLQHAYGGDYSDDFSLPGSQSQHGLDVLKKHQPSAGGYSSQIVLHDKAKPLTDFDSAMSTTIGDLQKLPHVLSAQNPLPSSGAGSASGAASDTGSGSASGAASDTGARSASGAGSGVGPGSHPPSASGSDDVGPLSADGATAYITVRFDVQPSTLDRSYLHGVDKAVQQLRAGGVDVEYGGPLGELARPEADDRISELIGFGVAILVLLIGFGSVFAAGVPLVTALIGVVCGLGCLGLLAAAFTFATVSPTLGTMIGLGVGIDYALFLITRHRQNLMDGADPVSAAGRAVATSGRAVLVSGCTVVIALAGLSVSGVGFIAKLGLAAAVTVVTAVLGALTLVPALLGLIGRRIDRYRVRKPVAEAEPQDATDSGARAEGAEAAPGSGSGSGSTSRPGTESGPGAASRPRAESGPGAASGSASGSTSWAKSGPGPGPSPEAGTGTGSGTWHRYAQRVEHRPWWFLAGGVVVIAVLAIPLLSIQLGHIGDGADPESFTDRRAYDLMSDAFGPGSNGPLTLVIDQSSVPSADRSALSSQAQKALADVPGAATITPLKPTQDGDVLVATAYSRQAPQDEETTRLTNRLTDETLPDAVAGTAATGYVTGTTAAQVDFLDIVSSRLPLIIATVVALAFLIILIVFRGLLVALKAAVLNVLSIAASYGVVVAVFQWGWGGPALGVSGTVPVESYVPMMMFAIVFGLSMDYEIFLLSRVHEAWLRTGDAKASVAHALEITARVITCAALIMVSVFAAFVVSDNIVVKMLGLGLAVSVLVDATVVRLLLVPAVMTLLGPAAWWIPRPLGRLLPHLDPEGEDTRHTEKARPQP